MKLLTIITTCVFVLLKVVPIYAGPQDVLKIAAKSSIAKPTSTEFGIE